MYDKCTITCPPSIPNKIEVIKAIRVLTGMGLKEAKDASERMGPQTFPISTAAYGGGSFTRNQIEEQFSILTRNGVTVSEPVFMILEDLRKLGAQALLQAEDDLANEILQLVLAEKLRRAK